MTTAQNKAIVTRVNKEFIEGGNIETVNELFAPDFINHTAPPGSPKGPEGVIYFFNQLLKPAFPDLKVEIHDQVAEVDKVTTRKTFHATHKAEFFGMPATNKKVIMEVRAKSTRARVGRTQYTNSRSGGGKARRECSSPFPGTCTSLTPVISHAGQLA